MKIEEVIASCLEQLSNHMDRGTTVELFKAMYTWPLDDFGSVFENIKRIDKHTRETLDKKIDTALMDFAKNPETVAESFMFRLRVESAIAMMTILTKSRLALNCAATRRTLGNSDLICSAVFFSLISLALL